MPNALEELLAQRLADRGRRTPGRPQGLFAAAPGEPQGNYLREMAPGLFGSLQGLLGTAPDQIEGGALDPLTPRVRAAAEATFPVGTALQALPFVGGLLGRAAALPGATGMGQRGMIRIPGRGQIPETRSDVNRLANRFQNLLDDAKTNYTADKSGISPARYFQIESPPTSSWTADDIAKYGSEKYKVRISDHKNVHGADFSVDPDTGKTFEEMLTAVRDMGVPIGSKVKPTSKEVVPDSFLEKFLGRPVAELKPEYLAQLRKNYVLDRSGGYWKDKRF